MRFNEALRKVTLDFKQKFLGECLNGEHCPVGVGPGLIPHPLDPALGMHTGWWDHSAARHVAGVDPITHPQLTGVTFGQHHSHFARYLSTKNDWPYLSEASGTVSVGVARLAPIDIPFDCTIDMLGYSMGSVSAGNVRLGLYRSAIKGYPDLPNTGALLVESASIAQPIAGDNISWHSVTPTALVAAQYFLAIQGDTATGTYRRLSLNFLHPTLGLVNPGRYFSQAYGLFTNPCPVTTGSYIFPLLFVRVDSNP